jgi:hypothetical protein
MLNRAEVRNDVGIPASNDEAETILAFPTIRLPARSQSGSTFNVYSDLGNRNAKTLPPKPHALWNDAS